MVPRRKYVGEYFKKTFPANTFYTYLKVVACVEKRNFLVDYAMIYIRVLVLQNG